MIKIQTILLILFVASVFCSGEPAFVSLSEVPKDAIRIILGPWKNASEIVPERRKDYDLIDITVEKSGEVSMHLPEYAAGIAWCYITAPGFEPAFLSGDVKKIQSDLQQYGDMKLKALSSTGDGVIAGVTYMDRQGRGVPHPLYQFAKETKLSFTGEKKQHYNCTSNADGFYMMVLPAGKYKVQTSYIEYEGAKPELKDYSNLGWIEVKAGQTTLKDLVLWTLYVD